MQKDTQMDIIAEYYMVLGEYTPNERYSESGVRVYVKQIEAVRLSVSGRSQILFTPAELKVIERYGDRDRRTTMGKLDILLGRFKDEETAKNAQSVIDKLGRISDKSYTDMYYVGQKRVEIDKERSLGNRLAEARVRADKLNAESRHHTVERRKGMIR